MLVNQNMMIRHIWDLGLRWKMQKKKYGLENFKKEIITEVNCEKDLNLLEKFWIKKLKSYDRKIGYNIAEGGNGGNTRVGYSSDELNEYYDKLSKGVKSSEKYSLFVKNKTGVKRPEHSEKMKKLYNEGKLKVGKNTKPISEETKIKIGKKNKGKKRTDETRNKIAKAKSKEVEKLKIDGEYLESYISIDEASKKKIKLIDVLFRMFVTTNKKQPEGSSGDLNQSLKIKKKIFKIMKVTWGNNITLTYQVLLAFYNLRKQN